MSMHKMLATLRTRGIALGLSALLVSGSWIPAQAASSDAPPYWVALRTNQTNMRVGPGRDYRINWIYQRAGLPLKVLRVMEGWLLVEDPDGARGWMLTQFVSRKAHTAMVRGQVTEIHENRDGSGSVMWRAEPGVIARLIDCSAGWCKVDIDGRQGFVAQSALWGADKP
jgi:SH3-like domain-containing protein